MFGRLPFLTVAALLLAVGIPATTTLARYTDAATTTGSFTSDTLAPPTSLAATNGATTTLTWTPSAYAAANPATTGYNVYRSATSGSGYTLVKSVTPGSASTTTDSPGAGTWYYVLKTTFQNWSSVNSNQATAVVTATSTTFKACVTTLADTLNAGDNNGYQTAAASACNNNNVYAVDTDTGTSTTAACGVGAAPDVTKDQHRFYGFVFALPGAVAHIDGLLVRADVKVDSVTASTSNLCAQLSWDGGTTWTTIQSKPITIAAETSYIFGATSDTWGHTWLLTELGTTLFRVRIIDASTDALRDFSLDYLAVSVTYAP